ncbi:MAG: flagellar hook-length control protein FliK [Carnobacterium sp.]|uniref:flagellar hook-length control protein FliK n=1 Tax=Carnobacterium sp. TaxID=48221 RepID=UPI003315C5F6
MNPTPVVTSSTGPQQLSNQKQEILPEEFETQLAGYLSKEQPSTIHKEVSNSKETTEKEKTDEESTEESPDETLNLDTPLLYTGLYNPRQELQPAEMNQNEPPKNQVISPMKTSELTFDRQVHGETEKMIARIQDENLVMNRHQNLLEESNMESITKEVIEPQVILKDQMVMSEELVQTEKIPVSKPTIAIESVNKANEKDVTNILMEESSLVETESVQISVKKETVMADTILSTGRFLTSEWKNGRIVNQPITESDNLTVNSLNELPTQTTETPIDSVQQLEADGNGSKSTVLTETLSTERVLKDIDSRSKKAESYDALTKVTEVDTQGQPVQQQQIVEATSIKQSSVVEPVRQAGIQQVSEVIMQQAETVLSGKQSIAHVTLTPERMGEVKITVELKDNVLITKIVVDTMETKDLLANGMHQLTDKLDRQNIRLGDLTIQLQEHASSDFNSQERQGEEKKNVFGKQMNFTATENETLTSEETLKSDTKRLSILV